MNVYKYSNLALKKNKHVIVDKPAITKISELEKLYNLSKHKKYLLDLSEYFGSINDSKNREMVDKITSEIDALE